MSRFRVAFLGLPLAALLLAHDGHDVVFAGLSRPGSPGERRLRRRLGGGRVVARGERSDAEIVDEVERARADLLVSWFWTRKIPPSAVGSTRLGGVGVHPSLLPRHRGPDPYFAAIDAGDLETGVTAHRIDAEYDTGAVLGRRALAIDPSWNAWALARALDRPSLALLREIVGAMARGERLDELAQDESLATRADAPDDDACGLDFSWPTAKLVRRVRALAPTPGAFFEIGDALVMLTEARPATSFPRVLLPGEAAVFGGAPLVRTSDGALEVVRGEIDGHPAGAAEFTTLFADARRMMIG